MPRPDAASRLWPLGIGGAAFLIVAAVLAGQQYSAADDSSWPREIPGAGAQGIAFVADSACSTCHADQDAAWRTSHHFHAMQPASDATVLGDFADVSVDHDGTTSRFFRRGGDFFIEADGPDGIRGELPVLYAFGIEPLQQYLVPLPGGRLQAYPIAWDTEAGRWFDLYPGVDTPPDHPLHWTGRLNNWNGRCAECHSTNVQTGFDLASQSFRTSWSAVNVGCQSCHGPGAAHVDWAEAGADVAQSEPPYGLVVDYGGLGAAGQVETCARCHSRRSRLTDDDRHGRPFLEDFAPALLREDLYHADGQILDEVFVYGSFVQSRMYQAGVTCTDCHDPHGGRPIADGNAVCTQCHNADPPDRFDGLRPATYDAPEHHHHEPGSPGAQCVNCHMPARTYMVVDPRRDHSMRIPRPDLSGALGAPNACTGCHIGRSDAWAAAEIEAWAGADRPAHYGLAIAAGRAGAPATGPLSAIAQDADQPAIVRATALDLLRQYGVDAGPAIVAGLSDPEPLVRAAAARGMALASPERRIPFLFPLLKDPVRAVRIEAGRQLAPIPAEQMQASLRQPFEAAIAEYVAAQTAAADTPQAHLNLARMWLERGRPDLAEEAYRAAADVAPDLGDPPYSLGLLLAEQGRLDEAADALATAADRLPGDPRIRYNLALALQRIGRVGEAERALLAAHDLAPEDADTLRALAILYAQQSRWAEAERYADALLRVRPGEEAARQLRDRIRQQRDR